MIKWFRDINENDFSIVGGKGFNLSKMFNYGLKVPDGFVVTSQAYDDYINKNEIKEKIDCIIKSNIPSYEKSREIKLLFSVDNVSADLKEEIVLQMNILSSRNVAVRSSATVEDLPGMSFAGQYSSYLNVKESDIVHKVVECWKSLWNERGIEYRERNNITAEFSHCVVIQKMINSKKSGVVFTANPLNGKRNELLINVSYGLGEAIVSGKVNPDQYTVNMDTGGIIKEEIAIKETLCQNSGNGIEYVLVDKEIQTKRALNEEEIKKLVIEAIKINNYFGEPQDIEFAFDENGGLFITQSRDITTLFPVESFKQDGKLRAHLSAGTVLLGMKEPFTPLGFDMFGQMFPTLIEVMTMQKNPIDKSFVKYNACRIYLDISYLLSSKFVSKQFAKAFSGNDLPLKDVMNNMIEKYGKEFTNQGIKFKIPWGVFKYSISMIGTMIKIMKIPNNKRYEYMIEVGEAVYQECMKESKELITMEEKLCFIQSCMKVAFVLSQKQALYCTEMNNFDKIKKDVEKIYGDRFKMEYLINSLPGCITQELTIKMNMAAKFFSENNIEPTVDHYLVKDIIERFGHRSNIELDFGTPRWSERPQFIIDRIKSYMTDKMYSRNLREIEHKAQRAEKMIEEIYQLVKVDKGEKKAQKLKKAMENYRIAAGMREYPKFDIVRIMGVARKVMLQVGEELKKEGHIENIEDVFFLFKEDILEKVDLKEKVNINKENYRREMKRTSIPRLVLNTGETFYSAQKIDPNSRVIEGIPLSPGVYEGKVRIVQDPLKSNLREGEIMVTESTNPGWTPLFAIAKGLIMEYGGPVSHGGIVAREYGIPAVVGINSALGILKDGQKVRINGESGVIEILD